ncbi:mono/diheme cytochrome c family protein [Granulicella aggregans]|uniref:Mono/diheme cytochrome c family protein n=1 Tax=Granulicella aggregans TaxID=474949 RepID=A0A7W7ZC46_9BACT|nr:cytochrome c [Granulicella aggregans]MBB5057082.1 mono/diheme cytochrome c family protein [Granulicella aggregans]
MKRVSGVAAVMLGACVLMGAADGSWLKRVPAGDKAKVNPLAGQKEAAEAGEHLYEEACSRCHGKQAEGKGNRPTLISERMKTTTDGELAWLLRNGNSWKGMPSWSVMPDGERWQLVAYMRSINTPATAAGIAVEARKSDGAGQ